MSVIRTLRIPLIFAIAAILLLSITVTARVFTGSIRADLTSEHLYTLSSSTKTILENLDEPIKARFFYTPEKLNGIPILHAYAERVKTLLKVYERISGGTFTVDIIEPEPFSTKEDDAVAFGIEPVPLNEHGDQLYFGLAFHNSVDKEKIFPFLSPEREPFLEYDFTRAVYDLSLAEKPSVSILSGLAIEGQPGGGNPMLGMGGGEEWTVLTYLKDEFDVTMIDKEAVDLPADTDILVLVRPPLLNDNQLYAIDQFVVGGGKLLLFTDPKNESSFAGEDPNAMERLLDHWGVTYDETLLAVDIEHAVRSSVSQQIIGDKMRDVYLDRPEWLLLDNKRMDTSYPATANLQQLFLKSPGFLAYDSEKSNDNLSWKPLITTGDAAMEVSLTDIADTEALLRNYTPSGSSRTLAGRLNGLFTTAYPEKAQKEQGVTEGTANGAVIIIADTDMLHDSTWIQKQNFLGNELQIQLSDNGAFALNIVDTLEGSGILSGLRGRTKIERPFNKVNAIRRTAEREFLRKQEELQQRLTDIRSQLTALSEQAKGREALISTEEQAASEAFRSQILETRSELRGVQHALNKDIERLGSIIKFILVGFIPLLIVLAGILLPGRIAGISRNT